MTRKLKKWIGATSALGITAAVIGMTLMSFDIEIAQVDNQEVNQQETWHYQGGSGAAQILNADNWVRASDGGTAHAQCGQGTQLPCTIPGPQDEADFQQYLNDLEVDGVMGESLTKRP